MTEIEAGGYLDAYAELNGIKQTDSERSDGEGVKRRRVVSLRKRKPRKPKP